MPFDAGLPTTAGRLVGIPLLVQQGDQDAVIPRELLDRTWAYLTGPAGAACTASRYPARATDLAAPEAIHGLPQQESTAVPMSLNSDDFDEKGRPALHAGRPESRIIVARDHSGEVRCFNERFPTRTDDLTAWCQCAASKAS